MYFYPSIFFAGVGLCVNAHGCLQHSLEEPAVSNISLRLGEDVLMRSTAVVVIKDREAERVVDIRSHRSHNRELI